MRRKYSDAFVERQINKIDELFEKTQQECIMLPDAFDRDEYSWLRKSVMQYTQHRVDRAYVQGFWYGWTLKEGDPQPTKSLSELAAENPNLMKYIIERDEFLERLLNPSDLGHAVTGEVRDCARILLGNKPVESKLKS